MHPKNLVAALGLAVVTAGCATKPVSDDATATTPTAATCGADKVATYVGQNASDAVIATITEKSAAKAVRVIRPDTMVTMDFRPDRLNIDVDAGGIITGLRCT